ncbi:MAG: AGE family epimerase/isomerase [Verrucomicrobiota bacterium]
MTSSGDLQTFLRDHLLRAVMPFWLEHSVDRQNGGLFTCLTDDGQLVSRDKYMWSQTRALWTFSALHNRVDPPGPWLEVANQLFGFLAAHGRDTEGNWVFIVDEFGNTTKGPDSIVTDAFAILGLVEYFHATGKSAALDLALDTYRTVSTRLETPGSYPTAPYPTPPGMRAHREYMQFSLAFCELGRAADDAKILADGRERGRIVLDYFLRSDDRVLLEYLDFDFARCDTPEGRTMVPGHGVESLYFQLLNFADASAPEKLLLASAAIRWCLERGWDPSFGGLFLGLDAEGKQPVYWKNAEMKLWWPHTEALPACLMAYEQTGAPWCLEWYAKIHQWAFAHFPVTEHGEWTQRLDRQGRKADQVVALPVKDPFHLPRGLIYSMDTLQRLDNPASIPIEL